MTQDEIPPKQEEGCPWEEECYNRPVPVNCVGGVRNVERVERPLHTNITSLYAALGLPPPKLVPKAPYVPWKPDSGTFVANQTTQHHVEQGQQDGGNAANASSQRRVHQMIDISSPEERPRPDEVALTDSRISAPGTSAEKEEPSQAKLVMVAGEEWVLVEREVSDEMAKLKITTFNESAADL